MIKYNDDSIFVGYIKQLLYTFNLPCCKIDNPSNKYYVGEYFINSRKNAIYKVITVDSNGRPTKSIKICDYKFGDEVLNITKTLDLRNNYYDSYTHEYLGEYLRFIRDYTGVNLMSMYNCFSNNMPSNLNVDDFDSTNSLYSIYMIPVKPNTTYTIAVDCHSPIKLACGHYDYHNFLDSNMTNIKKINCPRFSQPFLYTTPEEDDLTKVKTLKLFVKLPISNKSSIVVLEGNHICSTICTTHSREIALDFFEHISSLAPYVENNSWYFNGVNTNVDDSFSFAHMSYEDNKIELGLGTNYSNEEYQRVKNKIFRKYVLVFTRDQETITWRSEKIYLKDLIEGNYTYCTKSQLLQISTIEKYLLADRLIEYLIGNAITPNDEIINNIKKVQIMLTGNTQDKLFFDAYGFWTNEMRQWIYRYLRTQEDARGVKLINDYYDMLSYVDKDVESALKSLTLTKQAKERLVELGGDENGI